MEQIKVGTQGSPQRSLACSPQRMPMRTCQGGQLRQPQCSLGWQHSGQQGTCEEVVPLGSPQHTYSCCDAQRDQVAGLLSPYCSWLLSLAALSCSSELRKTAQCKDVREAQPWPTHMSCRGIHMADTLGARHIIQSPMQLPCHAPVS